MRFDTLGHLEFHELDHQKDYSKLEGSRGFVVDEGSSPTAVINTIGDAAFIALLRFSAGQPRGNHYHLKKTEHMIVLRGDLLCIFEDPRKSQEHRVERVLRTGEMVVIRPGCVHTYVAQGDDVIALEYAPQPFEQDDTIEL